MKTIFQSSEQRNIRVFVSSTFNDLMVERDFLVKKIFPRIRKFCQERDIEFIDIDLRWGITEEESMQGKVVEICLKEIERSRPYFIGILGDRYGWIPDKSILENHNDLIKAFPWIEKDINDKISITEMEIQFGVLRNPAYLELSMPHAFFYIKPDQKIVDGQTEKLLVKLSHLKNTLTTQQFFPTTIFSQKEELGEAIYQQLTSTISEEFPQETLTSLERVRNEHIEFARNRLKVYVNDPSIFEILDKHVQSDEVPLVITGESGMGKTALVANWLNQFNKNNPDTFVFFHFVGSSADSTSYINLVKRLIEEIKLEFGLEEPIPGDKEELINSLPGFLANTNVLGKRWVLIIDGINQLENEDNALIMNWLPVLFPTQIRVIFSVLPGNALDSLIRRDYILFKVPILNEIYREKLVREFLPVYGKNLRDEQFSAIAYSETFQNPLILISFLEELRIFGSHLQLNSFLSGFVNLGNIEHFFEQILLRIENDFNFNESINSGYIFSLIWISRKGLSEKEIIEVTGIRPIDWSQLYLAAEFHLINKGGLIGFSHDYFRKAVERKYLEDFEFKNKIVKSLFTYFLKEQLSNRSMEELPHLWTVINDYENLMNYLTNPSVCLRLFERDKIDFTRFCVPLRNLQGFEDRFAQNWEKSTLCRENYFETGLKTATILNELGYYKQALKMLKKIIKYAIKKEIPKEKLEQFYFLIGKAYWSHGEYLNATKYYKECYNIRSQLLGKSHIQCGEVLTQLGLSYQWLGKMVEAEEMYIKAHKIWLKHKMHNSSQMATSYTYLGLLNYDMGKYKKSIFLLSKSLKLSFSLFGNIHPMISENFNDIGLDYLDLGKIDKAKEYFDKSLEINLTLLGSDHPTTLADYNNIAYYYMLKGDIISALEYNHITLQACQKYYGDDNMETTYSYANIGAIYGILNEWDKALQNYQKSLDACKKQVGLDNEETGSAMQWVGAMYCEIGDYKKAKKYLENSLQIIQRYKKPSNPGIASIYNELGKLYLATGKHELALENFQKSLAILKKSPGINTVEYANTLDNIARYYIAIINFQDAESFLVNSLKIKSKLFNKQHYEVANTLCILAEYHKKNNQPDESKKTLLQAIEIYRLLNFERLVKLQENKLSEY